MWFKCMCVVRAKKNVICFDKKGFIDFGSFFSSLLLEPAENKYFFTRTMTGHNDSKNKWKTFIACAFFKANLLYCRCFWFFIHFILCLCIICKIKLGYTQKSLHWTSEWQIYKLYAFNWILNSFEWIIINLIEEKKNNNRRFETKK